MSEASPPKQESKQERCIAVVHLPHLPLSCLHNNQSARPPTVVVIDDESDRREEGLRAAAAGAGAEPFILRSVHRIVDADVVLQAQGVRPPQRVIDAQRLVPSLVVAVVSRTRIRKELIGLAELLLRHSPCVEPLSGGGLSWSSIAVDLTGLLRPIDQLLHDLEGEMLAAGQVGVIVVGSPAKRLSLVLARHLAATGNRKTRMVITAAQAERALWKVGIESLGLDVNVAESLHALGVTTVRDLSRLLPAGAAAHLFKQAREMLRLLSHVDDPLTPLRAPAHIIESIEVDSAAMDGISALEPLGFVLGPLCERLCRRVVARDASIAGVVVTLSGRHLPPFVLSLEFPAPLHDPKGLWSALMMRLEVTGVPGPVQRLSLRVHHLADGRRRQQDAFRESAATPQAVSGLLAELRAQYGDDVAGCLRISHEILPEQMSALSVLLSSSSSSLSSPFGDGRFTAGWPWPVRLLRASLLVQVENMLVVDRQRFCRLEGEDSTGVPFSRDYWRVMFAGERRALTFSDPESQEEWIQGWFD